MGWCDRKTVGVFLRDIITSYECFYFSGIYYGMVRLQDCRYVPYRHYYFLRVILL